MPTRIQTAINRIFSSRSPATIFSISLVLLLMLGWIDYLTGDYSLIVYYLIPVSLVTWFVSKRSGLLFCLFTLITRLVADEAARASKAFALKYSMLHYWNISIEFLFLMVMSLLFSLLKNNLEEEQALAQTDPLTGALNRSAFFDHAEHELSRARRFKRPFTVVYFDLDNFKGINEQLGHNIGDELLVTVAATIRSNIRSYEVVSRFGGDEFVILLPETDEESALSFLSKIRHSLQQVMTDREWQITVSISAVVCLGSPRNVDEIIRRADELMYAVKRSGKSRMLHTVVK